VIALNIEVREPGQPARVLGVSGAIDLGRECEGIVIVDPQASRRHLSIRPDEDGLVVTDLGSTNGTFVDGERITAATLVRPGGVIRVGQTMIAVLGGRTGPDPSKTAVIEAPAPEAVPVPAPPAEPSPSPQGPRGEAVPSGGEPRVRPDVAALAARETDAAVIRYRPGSAAEPAVGSMAAAARRARKRLAGLGSEPWGIRPQLCLVDPIPDPDRPGQLLAGGTVVDVDEGEIWMVVTTEAPPESPERPLALLFGAALPAAGELSLLLEGYGLHVGEAPDQDLRGRRLPPLADAEGETATAMALAFVRHLIAKAGEESFRRFLSEARPGRLDETAQQVFGAGLGDLEQQWQLSLLLPAAVKPGQFFRLTARYLRPHVRRELEMFVYMLLSLAFTMAFPFAFRRLIDDALPSGQMSEVLGVLTFLGVAFAVSSVANLRRSYLSAYVSSAIVRRIRTEMFDRIQVLSMRWFAGRQQGDVISRVVSDVTELEFGLSQTLREGLFQAVSLVAGCVVLFLLEPVLAVVVIAGLPAIVLVYRKMSAGFLDRSLGVQTETGALVALSTENFAAQPVVKAFGLERREHDRFAQVSDRLFGNELRLALFGGVFSVSVTLIVTGLKLFVIGLGAWLTFRGRITIGGLVAFISSADQVIAPVTALTGIGQQIQSASGALLRIQEVTEAVPDVADGPGARKLAPLSREIRLAGASFGYTPERQVLTDLELVIPAGTRTAFVGPTGAGKSSVLQLLMRFHDPDEGGVFFDGRDLRDAELGSVRSQIGVVFQDTFLFDGTIGENIRLGREDATDEEIQAAARAAELHDFVQSLPAGYDSPVGERGGQLSGGQRQRLAIARALVRDPAILVLDEATSALDPRTERLIADTLEKVGHGRTTIAVTHRLRAVTGYDQIVVLVAGKLAERGTHDELLARGRVYAELWAEQTGAVAPSQAAFDAVAALGRISIFAGVGRHELVGLAGRLRAAEVPAGTTVAARDGRLLLVRRGRARVLAPGLGGELVSVADLGPGDAFGVSAIVGDDLGSVFQATEQVDVLVLDEEAIASVLPSRPALAGAPGATATGPKPVGGRRLSRVTTIAGTPLAMGGGSEAVVRPEVVRPAVVPPPATGRFTISG